MKNQHPYENSRAAKMLREALSKRCERDDVSVRYLAKHVFHYSNVSISHMAIGRCGIPIDRVAFFCEFLDLDLGDFLWAVIEQRHPSVARHRNLIAATA